MSTSMSALDAVEYRTVEAIAGRIIPTTDTPGAIEAGAADYVQQALSDAYGRHLATYRRAIAEFNRHCVAAYGAPFADLSDDRQDDTLRALEAGQIDSVADGDEFFGLVRTHVMEGFLCEPHYGGNRDMIGWKLVGFPGQRTGYDDPYINRVIDLEPVIDRRTPGTRAK